MFLGSPAFAVPSLVSLAEHDNIEVALVVTQPDRPAGRGRSLTAPPVKVAALELGIPVFQPETLRDDDAVQILRDAAPDLLIVVAYGELLRRNVLDLTPHGCLNVHPSLLPRYRGAAPIPAAILNGDAVTGVSIMKLVRRLDAGPLVAHVEAEVHPDDTTGSLSDRLAVRSAQMLPDVARDYVAGRRTPVPQDESLTTNTHEWSTADAEIDWSQPARQIERLVRASNPWPVAWTTYGETRLRILTARVADVPSSGEQLPGTVLMSAGTVGVVTADGVLLLDVVQPAGKRSMPAGDWWRGLRRPDITLGPSHSPS